MTPTSRRSASPLLLGSGTLFSFVVIALGVVASDPKTPAAKPTDPPAKGNGKASNPLFGNVFLVDLLADNNPEPQNGVTLRLHVETSPKGNPDKIEVEWVLTYTGPRPPLTILRPSLTDSALKQRETELRVYATGKSKEAYRYEYLNPTVNFGTWPDGNPAKRFTTIDKGKDSRGKLALKITDVRDNFRTVKPDEFDATNPPKLYVKLYFNPGDRGESHRLDAWTGSLESDIVPLSLSKW